MAQSSITSKFLKAKRCIYVRYFNYYQTLIDYWATSFYNIQKKSDVLIFSPEVFKTPCGFKKQISILGILALGGIKGATRLIESAKAEGLFKYNNGSTNQKRWIRDTMKTPGLTQKSDLAEELKRKVMSIHFLASDHYENYSVV